MKRLNRFILCLMVTVPLIAQTSKRTAYLPELQRYIELTSLQVSLLIDSNAVYSHYLLDQDRQIGDLRAKIADPRYASSKNAWRQSLPGVCEGIQDFASEIREHNTRILDDSQKADLDYLLTPASESVPGRDAILKDARSANLLPLPSILEHVTENISSECNRRWSNHVSK